MNRLQQALNDTSNVALDFYLEDISTADVRLHIEEIVNAQIISTPQGELKAKLLKVLEDT